jgi:hypothetical protein
VGRFVATNGEKTWPPASEEFCGRPWGEPDGH